MDEIELERDANLSEVRKEVIRDLERNAYRNTLASELDEMRMNYVVRK